MYAFCSHKSFCKTFWPACLYLAIKFFRYFSLFFKNCLFFENFLNSSLKTVFLAELYLATIFSSNHLRSNSWHGARRSVADRNQEKYLRLVNHVTPKKQKNKRINNKRKNQNGPSDLNMKLMDFKRKKWKSCQVSCDLFCLFFSTLENAWRTV